MTDFLQLLLFMFAAVNPAAAAAAPKPPGRPLAPVVIISGSLAGLVLVGSAAISSSSILDALGVEPETFRVGAGVIFLVVGAAFLWSGGAIYRGSWDQKASAATSLALPVMATPAALAAAVTYGADRGEGETVAAAAIVIGLAAGLVAARVGRFEAPVDAIARLTGPLLIVVAAGLVVSGVRAI